MSLNKERRHLAYKNVKAFVNTRGQEVRFNLPVHLERKEDLRQDAKLLNCSKNRTLRPAMSWVIMEKICDVNDTVALSLSEGHFWQFVFSDRWNEYTTLRISEGVLLDKMINVIYHFTKQDIIRTYKIARFDLLDSRKKGGLNTVETGSDATQVRKPVKITFSYYAINKDISSNPNTLQTTNEDNAASLPFTVGAGGSNESTFDSCRHSAREKTEESELISNFAKVNSNSTASDSYNSKNAYLKFNSGNDTSSKESQASECYTTMSMGSNILTSRQSCIKAKKPSKPKTCRKPIMKNGQYDSVSKLKGETSCSKERRLKIPLTSVTNSIICFETDVDEAAWSVTGLLSLEESLTSCHSGPASEGSYLGKIPTEQHPNAHSMTDPSENVIVSDDEDETEDFDLISPKELHRSAFQSLGDYLRKRHRLLRRVGNHSMESFWLSSTTNLATRSSQSSAEAKELDEEFGTGQTSRFLFAQSPTQLYPIKDCCNKNDRFTMEDKEKKDDDHNECTCAHELPRCKQSIFNNKDQTAPDETVKSWCIPLTQEQKYRLKLMHKNPPTIPPLQTSPLNTRHSILRMRRINRHKSINNSISGLTPSKQRVLEKLEDFLETKFLPDLPNREKKKSPNKLMENKGNGETCLPKADDIQISTQPHKFKIPDHGDKIQIANFMENFKNAMGKFVVRKEQVTIADGWHTVTSITINRHLKLNYGQPHC